MKKTRWQKRLELWAGHQLLVGLLRWAQKASFGRLYRTGDYLGGLIYRLSRRYRTIAERNLTLCFPEKSPGEIRQIALDVFRNLAKTLLETLKMVHMKDKEVCERIRLEGLSYLDEALAKGKGVLLITAHFGNWELMARRLVIQGYKVHVVAREADYEATTGLMTRLRETSGYRVIMREEVVREGLRCLKRNECLGLLPDQNQTDSRLFVDFFGRPACTAPGAALLAMRTGAAMIPLFDYRLPDNTHRAVLYPPIEISSQGDKETDVRETMARITRIIEEQVRQFPSQWLWLHDRWATRPPQTGANDARTY